MKEITAQSYTEAETFLNEVPKFTNKNPMEKTKEFYEYIQNCDNGIYSEKNMGRIIHVAGTNGKGSVCAFLKQICMESGYKTGMFISPHLVTTRERFSIDKEIISENEFIDAFNWLSQKINEYNCIKPEYSPTYFERLFFMGVYVFTRAGVDVTVLETGLGGRLDTTNVIKKPSICVITEIGFDHMEYLGNTVEEIAGEKAGIIKPEIPVVFSNRKKEVCDVISKKAAQYGCTCHAVSKNDYKINEIKKKYIDFSVVSRYYDYGGFTALTTALYQVENAAVAIRTCEILKNDCGFDKITTESIKKGINNMRWPGRMEEIIPGVFIDGAHNEDGIEAFVQSLNGNLWNIGSERCVLIFSVVKDKQYDKMIKMLCGLSMVTDFIITHIPGERGADLVELKKIFDKYTDKSIFIRERIEDAISLGMAKRGSKGIVYIVGSLYLAGLIEKHFASV